MSVLRTVHKISNEVNAIVSEPSPNTEGINECDTDADTCCLGKNFMVYKYTQRTADVYAYDKSLTPATNIPIVTGATAKDDETTGETYILLFNESLYYGTKMDHSLFNPNQLRKFGVPVWDNPFDRERPFSIQISDEIEIPLCTNGTKIYFKSRVPTSRELEECPKIHVTSEHPWNPNEVELKQVISENKYPNVKKIEFNMNDRYAYRDDISTNDIILNEISSSLTTLNTPNNGYDLHTLDVPRTRTYVSHERHNTITADKLSDMLCIGPDRAKQMLRVTRQQGTRSAILPIGRRYRADRMYDVKRLSGKFATDTLYGKVQSLRGYKATQIYSHKCGFKAAYHVTKVNNDQVGQSLNDFIFEYGAPSHLTYDGAAVQVGARTVFQDTIRRANIDYHVSGPRRPNENPAEGAIRDIKMRWYRLQTKMNVPDRLWDFGITYVCETGNIIPTSSKYAKGRTPIECITGETPDISEYTDFGFYDWVMFRNNAGLGVAEIGRWIGVSHRVGQLMSYWVLPSSGIPISCTTVQRVTESEKSTEEFKEKMNKFNMKIESRLGDQVKAAEIPASQIVDVPRSAMLDMEQEDDEFFDQFNKAISDPTLKEADEYNQEYGVEDPYIGMNLGLPHGPDDGLQHAKVKKRVIDDNGTPVGIANNNPLLDTRQYEVEFMNGESEIMTANLIAENIISRTDEEGYTHKMLDEIEDHRVLEDAIPMNQGTFITKQGTKRKRRTTKGWDLLLRWKDGSSNWVSLKDVKDSYPIEVMEYAINHKIQDQPAFAWWIPFVKSKRASIISKAATKYWDRTHKFGIEVPKSVKEAIRIDKENGNTLWQDAIALEMKNVRIAFEVFEGDISELKNHEFISGHLVFDIKLGENFRRKARYVADGYKTSTPSAVTYSSVTSRDSVRIFLLLAALNDVDIQSADVQNAFLSAPVLEKVWLTAGPEFGPEQGKNMIVVRALYGLKSASASFRSFMAQKLDEMGFRSSKGDFDIWMRPATKSDGSEYYEYVMLYVDDVMASSQNAVGLMKELGRGIKYKNDLIEPPTNYLGAQLKKKKLPNGMPCWCLSSEKYVNAAIKNVDDAVKKKKRRIPSKVRTPMTSDFVPELDGSNELSQEDLTFYQELIGILRWATELGRADILHEVSILSQYQACPREGHLNELLHIFGYLKKHPKLSVYMDPSLPNIDYSDFTTNPSDFAEYYRGAQEQMPNDMPRARGHFVTMTAFVDASFAQNKKTRKSHTGFIIFVNRAPVMWFSKRQATVETSTFSAEYMAMKSCVNSIEALRFKLRMFGVPIDGPAYVYCDNESVVNNSSKVESTLNKKHNSVAYHYVRNAVAASIITVAWINRNDNLADAFTKRLPEATRNHLFGNWMY